MLQHIETLAELRGSLKHVALTLQAIKPRMDQMEEGLQIMVDQFGNLVEFCTNPPEYLPANPEQALCYRASRTATEKARCAIVASIADTEALMETLDATIDRLNVAAYVVAAETSTLIEEGFTDAAV